MLETIESEVRDLSLSVRKLSVIAAALKLRNDPAVDLRIRDLITGSAKSTLGADVGALEDRDASMLSGMIDMTFAEASELLHNPARSAEPRFIKCPTSSSVAPYRCWCRSYFTRSRRRNRVVTRSSVAVVAGCS
jgi:hypothetical protein